MGKDSGSGSEVYDYYGTIAGVICEGPVQSLLSIVVDGAEVWPRAAVWAAGPSVTLGALRAHSGRTWECILAHTSSDVTAPPNLTYWAVYSLDYTGNPFDDVTVIKFGTFRLYWGTSAQVADEYLSVDGNEFDDQHPAYKGVCYVVLVDFKFGRERTSAPNIEVIVARKPNQTVITGPASELTDGQANLAAFAAELFTSSNAAGMAPAALDTVTAQAAADRLHTHADMAASSPLFADQGRLQDALSEMAEIADLHWYSDPVSGLIKAIGFEHGSVPPATALVTGDLVDPPAPEGEGLSGYKTRAVVSFSDRARGFKRTSETVNNQHAYSIVEEHRPLTLSRPHITRLGQAIAHAQETLRTQGIPQMTMTAVVRREKARDILPGEYVTIDIEGEPGGAELLQYFRVIERSIPNFGPITLELEAEEAIPPIAWTPGDTVTVEIEDPVPEITSRRIIDATPAIGPLGSVLVMAERPTQLIVAAGVWFDTSTGGTFQRIGDVIRFATRATLRSDVSDSATTLPLTVADQADIDRMLEQPGALGANDNTLLAVLVKTDGTQIAETGGYQHVEFAAISAQALVSGTSYDLTVLRARLGTLGKAFVTATTEVWIIPRDALTPFEHGDLATLRSNRSIGTVPDTGYFRLTPRTFVDELELSDADNITYLLPEKNSAAPALTLTAAPSATTTPYPRTLVYDGDWTDADADLIGWQIHRRKGATGPEVLIAEAVFTSTGDPMSFSVPVDIDEIGTWYVIFRGFDYLGNVTERIVTIAAAGTGKKVATPTFWMFDQMLYTVTPPAASASGFTGPMEIRCGTVGANIEWRIRSTYTREIGTPIIGTYSTWRPYTFPAPPGVNPGNPWVIAWDSLEVDAQRHFWRVEARAALGGYADSDTVGVILDVLLRDPSATGGDGGGGGAPAEIHVLANENWIDLRNEDNVQLTN